MRCGERKNLRITPTAAALAGGVAAMPPLLLLEVEPDERCRVQRGGGGATTVKLARAHGVWRIYALALTAESSLQAYLKIRTCLKIRRPPIRSVNRKG